MLSKQEIRDWLLKNAVDEYGVLRLEGLDFTLLKGVDISEMKVGGYLRQNKQIVCGFLQQDEQTVGRYLLQGWQTVKQSINQSNQLADRICQIGQQGNVIYSHKPFEHQEMTDKNHWFEIVEKEEDIKARIETEIKNRNLEE